MKILHCYKCSWHCTCYYNEFNSKNRKFQNDIDTAIKAPFYAGVYSFPNESGKMVGKSKTSPFADRKLKSLLYMGTKLVPKYNKEYTLYYQKKKLEGKSYFLIMNNISN